MKSPSAWSRRAWLVRRTPPPAHHEHVYVGNLIRLKAREHTPTHPNRGRRQARSLASVFSDNLEQKNLRFGSALVLDLRIRDALNTDLPDVWLPDTGYQLSSDRYQKYGYFIHLKIIIFANNTFLNFSLPTAY